MTLPFFGALQASLNVYSSVFIMFWGVMVLACIGLWLISFTRILAPTYLESLLFWGFGTVMVAFAAFRPIGITRDDLAYLEIFNGICPAIFCGKWIQGSRDWGWHSLMGILKSFIADPRLMIYASAVVVLFQLGLIYRLARHPLLALVLFTGVFYQELDLTAFRIAMASTFFLWGFVLLVLDRPVIGGFLTLTGGLFHKQAFIGPLILIGPHLRERFFWLPLLVILPIGLMFLGQFPSIPDLLTHLGFHQDSAFVVKDGMDAYLGLRAADGLMGWRTAPIVMYPLLILAIGLAWDAFQINRRLYSYSAATIVWGAWFLWAFASLPIVQVRFFDFLIFPVIFLAGNCRYDGWRLSGIIAVSSLFVIKYNVLHTLFQ
ncbi:MAG: EpsG family protein [Polynucleobacter sp.]